MRFASRSLVSVGYPFGGFMYECVGKTVPFLVIAVVATLESGRPTKETLYQILSIFPLVSHFYVKSMFLTSLLHAARYYASSSVTTISVKFRCCPSISASVSFIAHPSPPLFRQHYHYMSLLYLLSLDIALTFVVPQLKLVIIYPSFGFHASISAS